MTESCGKKLRQLCVILSCQSEQHVMSSEDTGPSDESMGMVEGMSRSVLVWYARRGKLSARALAEKQRAWPVKLAR